MTNYYLINSKNEVFGCVQYSPCEIDMKSRNEFAILQEGDPINPLYAVYDPDSRKVIEKEVGVKHISKRKRLVIAVLVKIRDFILG